MAIAASLDDLARASSVIAKVTPIEQTSAWEGGRIVTTTRVRVDEIVAGASGAAGGELRIRTLGGRVEKIGQLVEGEAVFVPSQTAFVFLTALPGPLAESAYVVAGRGQGQLLVKRDAHGREVVRVGHVGALVERSIRPPLRASGPRIAELDGTLASTVATAAKQAFEVGHAK